jgi:hypothetical protein
LEDYKAAGFSKLGGWCGQELCSHLCSFLI